MTIRLTSFIDEVKNYMRDKPDLNRMLSAQETHDATIALCIDTAVSLWNSTPPIDVSTISVTTTGAMVSGYDEETEQYGLIARQMKIIRYPSNAKGMLLEATIVEILKSVLLLRMRNRLMYSDGSVGVQEEEGPIQGYTQMLDFMYKDLQRRIYAYKHAANLNQLLDSVGGIGSDYSFIPIFTNSWNYSFGEG